MASFFFFFFFFFFLTNPSDTANAAGPAFADFENGACRTGMFGVVAKLDFRSV